MKSPPSLMPNLVPTHSHESLSCPDCLKNMTPYKCEHIIVHKCNTCNGLWFDDKELGVFRNSLNKFDLSRVDVSFYPPETAHYRVSICPRCEETLFEGTYAYNSKVKIYRCQKCRGIWLPIYEFINLVELSKLGQAVAKDASGLAREIKSHHLKVQRTKELAAADATARLRGFSLFLPIRLLTLILYFFIQIIRYFFKK